MSFLTEQQVETIETAKSTLKIDCAFDTVLNVQQAFQEDLTQQEKTEIALRLLVKNAWNLNLFTKVEKTQLLDLIYQECISTKSGRRSENRQYQSWIFRKTGNISMLLFFKITVLI